MFYAWRAAASMKSFAELGLAKTSKGPLGPKPCGVMGDNFGVSRGAAGVGTG